MNLREAKHWTHPTSFLLTPFQSKIKKNQRPQN